MLIEIGAVVTAQGTAANKWKVTRVTKTFTELTRSNEEPHRILNENLPYMVLESIEFPVKKKRILKKKVIKVVKKKATRKKVVKRKTKPIKKVVKRAKRKKQEKK